MAPHIEWYDVIWRLFLTMVAGILIGLNREKHGSIAGLRTTLLVCLAASISMIEVNVLLSVHGKAPDSYVVMDLMRLPLGILSGMGFIGAGVILRKDKRVMGVTTAATLWFATVIGLCFGGGQTGLGLAGLILGLIVLQALKPLEQSTQQEHQASFRVVAGHNGPTEDLISKTVAAAGYKIASLSVSYEAEQGLREMNFLLEWHSREHEIRPPPFVAQLAALEHTHKVSWET